MAHTCGNMTKIILIKMIQNMKSLIFFGLVNEYKLLITGH